MEKFCGFIYYLLERQREEHRDNGRLIHLQKLEITRTGPAETKSQELAQSLSV